MHAIFILYGKRSKVERLLRDMEAQKHFLNMRKGKKTQGIWTDGHVRLLPFGVYDYVFPKEDKNLVLTTLGFDKRGVSTGGTTFKIKFIKSIIKKALDLEDIPEFDNKLKYLWARESISIIPLGIREDGDMTETGGEFKGWTHEAI